MGWGVKSLTEYFCEVFSLQNGVTGSSPGAHTWAGESKASRFAVRFSLQNGVTGSSPGAHAWAWR